MAAKYVVSLRKVLEGALEEFRQIDYKNSTIRYMKAVFPAGITEQQRSDFWTNYLTGAGDDKRSWVEYTEYSIDEEGKESLTVYGSLSGENIKEGLSVIEPVIKWAIQRLLLRIYEPNKMPDSDTFFKKFAEESKIIDEGEIDIERMAGSVYLWFEFLLKLAKEQGSSIDVLSSSSSPILAGIDYTVDSFYCLNTDALKASINALEYLLGKAEQKTEFASGNKADLETARTAKKKPWYKKVLVWVFLTVMAAVISILIERWFFPQETQNSSNNSTRVKTEGDLSPAVNTGPNSTVNIYYKQDSQIQEEKSAIIFAYVSPDGKILQSNNFRWKITKAKNREGNIVYVINGRQGDTTAISVLPDNSMSEYKVSNGYDGMVITFTCAEEKISNFRIEVKY